MLSQSDKTIAAWKATERTLAVRVTIAGKEYTATDINSLKYDAGAYTGETFAIGSTYSNNVQIEFSHLVEGLKLGDIVEVSIGIKVSNKYIYDSLGVFIISSEIKMDRNNNLTTISASDAFLKLEGMYKSKLTYPAKVLDVISEICAMVGVDLNTSELSRLPKLADLPTAIEGQSYRKALGWIAQLYAGYATFDRSGQLTIRTVAEPAYELDTSQYEQGGLTKNEATYKIGGIQCQVTTKTTTRDDRDQETTTTLQSGSASGAQIKLENNVMTQERLDYIWKKLKDINFYPFSLNWFGNPAVEAGDWLVLYDKQGNDFVVPNNSYTLEFNGGLSAVSKADQSSSSSQMISWTGGVMQTIKELQHRNAPDGTVIFPASVTEPPKNAHFNDVWFKKNGNSTELWIFERQSDGTGKWQRKDVANDAVKKQIEDQQKDLISATNKANEAFNTASAANSNANSLYQKMTELRATFDTTISDTEAKLKTQAKEEAKKALDKAQKLSDDYTASMTNVNAELLALNSAKDKANADINKLATDVSGVRGLYTDLNGRITQFSAGVDGLSAQLTDTKKQLASVKLTADGANAKFANQQNEIASLKAKAGTIEQQMLAKVDNNLFESFKSSTARELKEKLTATDLNGYVKTTELTRTADGLRASVTAVEGKINNLNLGGRNYLQGTADFTWPTGIGDWNGPKKSIEQYNSDLKMLHVSNTTLGGIYTRWSMAFPNGELQVGENYTFSFDAKGTGTFLAVGSESDSQSSRSPLINTSLTSNWKRYSTTGTITELGRAFTIYFKDNYDVYIKCVKVEKSNKASDWTPAPEDANKQFSAVNNTLRTYKTDLDILKDGMSVRVSEIAQVNSKINNLTIGGTNLLSNTSTEIRSNDAPNGTWVEGAAYSTVNPLTESKYVLSFEARGDVDKQTIGTFLWSGGLGGGNIAKSSVSSDGHTSTAGDGQTFVTLSTSWKKYWVKYEVAPDNTRKSAIVGRRWSDSRPSGKVYIRKVKLETGDKATDYSPAPEDFESKYASLNVKVDGINSTVATKAEKSYVDQRANEIKTTVSTKADTSYVTQKVNEINAVVANKADSSFVIQKANEINNVVKNKSDISYVNQKVSEINLTVANKANLSYVNQKADQWQLALTNLKIGGTNLVRNTSNFTEISPWASNTSGQPYLRTHPFWKNGTENLLVINNSSKTNEVTISSHRFSVKPNTEYTLSFYGFNNSLLESYDFYFLGRKYGSTADFTQIVVPISGQKLSNSGVEYKSVTFNVGNSDEGYIRFDNNRTLGDAPSELYLTNIKIEEGNKATAYSPSPDDNKVAITAVKNELNSAINLRVQKSDLLSQINVQAGHTLIQSKKIYLDADTVAFSGKAFIPSAAIANLSADKINGGTINGRTVNVTNLNANNITSGTINGQNLSINLDNGIVNFQKGKLHNFNRTVDIDLDDSYISTADQAGRIMFKGGSIQIVQPNLFDKSSDPYLEISNSVGSGSFHGGVIKGRDNVVITNSANSSDYFLTGGLGQSTFAGLFVGQSDYAGWQPTVIGGADRGVYIVGGKKMPSSNNILSDHSRPLITGSPFIHVGTNSNGLGSSGDRIYIEGDYVHIPSAYRKTSGGSGNVIVAPDGALVRAVSALKYKKDVIRTYTDDYGERLLQLPTATWLDKNEVESSMNAQRHFGMIAEDFADNDLDIFVTRDADGEIEGLQYDRIAPALIPVIRNLKTKVDNWDKIAKNSIINTSQGKTAINAYETAEYYFGDIAKTNTGPTKRVKIMIDPLFLETINTDIDYHVFVSSYDNGYAWVSERAKDYFVIESNVPNLPVSYEIKAKRKQYENVRLDKVDVNLTGGTN